MKRWSRLGLCTRIAVALLALFAVEFVGGAIFAANVGGRGNVILATVLGTIAAIDIALAIFVAKTDLFED